MFGPLQWNPIHNNSVPRLGLVDEDAFEYDDERWSTGEGDTEDLKSSTDPLDPALDDPLDPNVNIDARSPPLHSGRRRR